MNINEEQLAFNAQMGLALQQFAHVEFALAEIVAEFFPNLTAKRNARIGFRAIENFRAKLQYVDSILAYQRLPESRLSEWATLSQRAGAAARKRNKLAHFWVITDDKQSAGRRRMLIPTQPGSTRTKPKRGQKYPNAVCLRDIASYRLEFAALMRALENFQARLGGQQEPFPKSQEQPRNPPTIAQIRREIYVYAQHPPEPFPG